MVARRLVPALLAAALVFPVSAASAAPGDRGAADLADTIDAV